MNELCLLYFSCLAMALNLYRSRYEDKSPYLNQFRKSSSDLILNLPFDIIQKLSAPITLLTTEIYTEFQVRLLHTFIPSCVYTTQFYMKPSTHVCTDDKNCSSNEKKRVIYD